MNRELLFIDSFISLCLLMMFKDKCTSYLRSSVSSFCTCFCVLRDIHFLKPFDTSYGVLNPCCYSVIIKRDCSSRTRSERSTIPLSLYKNQYPGTFRESNSSPHFCNDVVTDEDFTCLHVLT